MKPLQHFRKLSAPWQHWRRWQKIVSIAGAAILLVCAGLYVWIFADLPAIERLPAGLMLPSSRILDRYGRLLYQIIDRAGGQNTEVPLSRIPQALIEATIATEDRNFY